MNEGERKKEEKEKVSENKKNFYGLTAAHAQGNHLMSHPKDD
jgi:hypothetical protein